MKAIIIGATSGIGRELAKQMSNNGYVVGMTGRRSNLLDSLEQELPSKCYKSEIDLINVTESAKAFKQLIEKMGGVDLVVINSGTGSIDPQYPISDELETIAVNVKVIDRQMEPDMNDELKISPDDKQVLEQVREIKGFYSHLITYVLVIIMLFVINFIIDPTYIWAWWAAMGWGVGIISHALSAFEIMNFFGPEWEKRQVEKRLERKL